MLGLEQDVNEAYERFIQRVVQTKQVWVLAADDSLAWCVSNEYEAEDPEEEEELGVIVVWSEKAYAERCAVDDWSNYIPQAIPLEVFTEQLLPEMEERNDLVGPNWNAELIGKEVEPKDLKTVLEEAIRASKQ